MTLTDALHFAIHGRTATIQAEQEAALIQQAQAAFRRARALRQTIAASAHVRPGAHIHLCETPHCETYLVCATDYDRCPVGKHFHCAGCELDEADYHMNRLTLHQEPTRT